jgi:hypothetical protein
MCDPKVDNIMFRKDLFKDWLAPHLLHCGWYLNYPKDNTPTLEIPSRKSIEPAFMETLTSFVETQVEGGRWKVASKGKGKLKEKMVEPPSFDAFMEVFKN